MSKLDRFSEHTEDGKDGYTYFKPEYFFKYGFLTPQEIEQLKNSGAKILSLGSGPAYLEQELVKRGIPQENIILSDKDESHNPPGFKIYHFDMFNDWPNIDEGPFDLIIAPESFGATLPWLYLNNVERFTPELKCLLIRVIKLLKPCGEFRMIDSVMRLHEDTEEIIRQVGEALENTGVTIEVHNEILSVVKNETSPNNE